MTTRAIGGTSASKMLIHYLDAREEYGSVTILNQLGVTLPGGSAPKTTHSFEDLRISGVEFNTSSDLTYVVKEGSVYMDVRDSADVWIRVRLNAGQAVRVKASLFRRFCRAKDADGADLPLSVGYDGKSAMHYTVRFPNASDSIVTEEYHTTRELVCELCRVFFDLKWVTGTGGSISIRYGNRVYMTPSGVQKERILPDELYVTDTVGNVLCVPKAKPGKKAPKLSDCSQLFLQAFQLRGAGAVLHSHHYTCNLATMLFEGQTSFKISHQEMIKGIQGYGYFDTLEVPIIENTAFEYELTDFLRDCIQKNPRAVAVLVRRHGMYVWGDTWEAAKRHAESLHYLFEIALQYRSHGYDFLCDSKPVPTNEDMAVVSSAANGHANDNANGTKANKKRARSEGTGTPVDASGTRVVLLDIEGTTTPITFVKDTLFPYAAQQAATFLRDHQQEPAVATLMQELAAVSAQIPGAPTTQASNVDSLAALVKWLIAGDHKTTPLKQLQGLIWEGGYARGVLKSQVYADVPAFFKAATTGSGKRCAIYSSGSRDAQRLLFKHTDHGDLRQHLSCYFDTKTGPKREHGSYTEIRQSLGVDDAAQVRFLLFVWKGAGLCFHRKSSPSSSSSLSSSSPLPSPFTLPIP
jgi:methylthioribulose 1-phosphate dehydratase/enolase-phosphatase E1